MEKEEVKAFYDDFLESRMLHYRLNGNTRLEKAVERIHPYLDKESNVLDIGSGIGIVAEKMAFVAKQGHIWATDLSERNIWYAKQTVEASNVTFFAADVLADFEKVRRRVDGPVDIVTMVDVIEHLPKSQHATLFENIRSISSEQALIIATYPSPQYQRYLKQNRPDHMQIIDQVIEVQDLVGVTQQAGFQLKHFSMEADEYENQYVHCVLQANVALSDPTSRLADKVKIKIKRAFRKMVRPLRRRKYIYQVFEQSRASREQEVYSKVVDGKRKGVS